MNPSVFSVYDGVGMQCPACSSARTGVVESRSNCGSVYRRRRCKRCSFVFATVELPYDPDTKYIECSDEPPGGGGIELPGLFPYTSLGRKGGR